MIDALLRKIEFNFEVDSNDNFEYIAKTVSNFSKSKLNSVIEKTIKKSRLNINGDNYVIDKIEINLPELNINEFHLVFDYIDYELTKRLQELFSNRKKIIKKRSFIDFIDEYYKFRHIPWWIKSNENLDFLFTNNTGHNFSEKVRIISILSKNFNFFKKIFSFFSKEQMNLIINDLTNHKSFHYDKIINIKQRIHNTKEDNIDTFDEMFIIYSSLKKSLFYLNEPFDINSEIQNEISFEYFTDDVLFNNRLKIYDEFKFYNPIKELKKISLKKDLSKLFFLINQKSLKEVLNFDVFIKKVFVDVEFFLKILKLFRNNDEVMILLSKISTYKKFNSNFLRLIRKIDLNFKNIEEIFIANNLKLPIVNLNDNEIKSFIRYKFLKLFSSILNYQINKLEFYQQLIFDFIKFKNIVSKIDLRIKDKLIYDSDYYQILISIKKSYPFNNISSVRRSDVFYMDMYDHIIRSKKDMFWIKRKSFDKTEILRFIKKSVENNDKYFIKIIYDNIILNKNYFKKLIKIDPYLFINLLSRIVREKKDFKTYYYDKDLLIGHILEEFYDTKNLDSYILSNDNKLTSYLDLDSINKSNIELNKIFNDLDLFSYYIEFGSLPFLYNKINEKKLKKIFFDSIIKNRPVLKKYLFNWSKSSFKIERFVNLLIENNEKTKYLINVNKKLLGIIYHDLFSFLRIVLEISKEYGLLDPKFFEDNFLKILIKKVFISWTNYKFIIHNPIRFLTFTFKDDFINLKNISTQLNINNSNQLLKKVEKNYIIQFREMIIDQIINKRHISFTDTESTNLKNELSIGIVISNSGLVLFWPYLKTLFMRLGLLNDEKKEFIDDISRNKAILATDYIVNGKFSVEKDFILNKILCGIELDWIIDENIKLNEYEIEICDSAITAVLNNWKKVKTITTLRDWFLKREGVITLKDEVYILDVEKKPFDIFLKTLSWGFSNIKHSLMSKMLVVNWKY
tara:strand:- start:1776 stop:4670 length:2895 start_codon:yes stop_codon:yes gene_type:complete